MNKPVAIDVSATLSTPLDAETAWLVAELAERRGQSPEQVAAEAVRRVADFDASFQVGIDEADRGNLIPHEEIMAELDEMIAQHRARCPD